jgi:hypothetical protein
MAAGGSAPDLDCERSSDAFDLSRLAEGMPAEGGSPSGGDRSVRPDPEADRNPVRVDHDRVVPDPNNWVGQIGYGVATANNRPHWVGPNGMETVNAALQATDRETINDFWAERILEANQDIPEVSCIWYPRVWGAADYVHNVEQEPFGQYNLKRMWIEDE